MTALSHDVRYALRVLAKDPGFTLTAVFTLALGIGAATTIFSVVNKVLLEPLNYRDPSRLLLIRERIRQITPELLAAPAPDLLEFQRETELFEAAAAWRSGDRDLSSESARPARVPVSKVTANLFDLAGATAALGRTFTIEEDRTRQPVAVLSDSMWRSQYAGDPNILGRIVLLDRIPYTVVGVMPPSFSFPPQGLRASHPAAVWVPMAFTDRELQSFGDNFDTNVVARMKPGVTLEKTAAVLKGTARRIFEKSPAESRKEFTLEIVPVPLAEQIAGNVRSLMLLLAGAVVFLLLIACGNVANLMLTRAAAREREFAIRTAVGAGRGNIVRQWLTESVLLSLCGGALGILFAWYGTDALAQLTTLNIPRISEVRLDLRALMASVAVSVLTGLIFGTAPAFFSGSPDLAQGLKEGGRTSAGKDRRRLRSVLVVTEVALALVLLIGAGLLLRSFLHVRATDPGFLVENVLTMDLSLPGAAYGNPAAVRTFLDELDRRLRALPGVMAVGAANGLPLHNPRWQRLFSMDNETSLRGQRPPTVFTVVHRDYFQALGMALKRGRLFTDQDRYAEAPVLIVNERMAKQLWPGQDALGKRIKFGPPMAKMPFHTVAGIVSDAKEGSLEGESLLHSYVPAAQSTANEIMALSAPSFVVRAAQAPESLIAGVRSAVASLDPRMPVAHLETMEQTLDGTLSSRRLQMYVLALFSGAALLLSALGVYGVIGYSVTQRTHEIGIRMALGATASGVVGLVVRQGLLLAAAGIAVGLALSSALTRYMESLLFEVKPVDAATYAVVAAILLAAACAASLLPARRAMKVDPMVALRRE